MHNSMLHTDTGASDSGHVWQICLESACPKGCSFFITLMFLMLIGLDAASATCVGLSDKLSPWNICTVFFCLFWNNEIALRLLFYVVLCLMSNNNNLKKKLECRSGQRRPTSAELSIMWDFKRRLGYQLRKTLLSIMWINMDYSLCKALSYNMEDIPVALVMYDIMCQYGVHLQERVAESPKLSISDSLELRTGIRLFHIHGHQDLWDSCLLQHQIKDVEEAYGIFCR